MFWGRQPGHPPASPHGASRGGRAHTQQRPRVRRWESPPHRPARGTRHALLPSSCRAPPGSPRPRQSGGGRSRGWRLSLPSAPRGFGDGWRLRHGAPPGHGDPARAGGRRLGSGWRPRGMLPGESPCAGTPPRTDQLPTQVAHAWTRAWLYLAPLRWWRLHSWKWPSASSAGKNTVWAPGRAGQRDRGAGGTAGAMLGHGAPWGHAEMCHRAGMPWEDGWMDG